MKQRANKNENTHAGKTVIKSIRQRVYHAYDKFGEIERGELFKEWMASYNCQDDYLEEFNFDGQTIKKTYFNQDGSISGSYTYKFIESRLAEECFNNIRWPHRGGSYILTNSYDDNGNLIKSISESDSHLSNYVQIYKYNNNNQLIEIRSYSPNGIFQQKVKQSYNQNNLIYLKETYSSNGHLGKQEQFEHNGNKLKIHRINYFPKGGFHGDPVSKSYDTNGNLLHYRVNSRIEDYFYDKSNLLIKQTTGDKNEILTYTYEKDDIGNWIKKTHFRNDIPFAITIREIEYH